MAHINHRRETREQVAAWHCGYSGRDAHLYRGWQRQRTHAQRVVRQRVRALSGLAPNDLDIEEALKAPVVSTSRC